MALRRAGCHQQPMPIETSTLWDDSAAIICNVAKTGPYELIVMSTHSRTSLAHICIDSVAERVVYYASCAVLIVRAFPGHQS
jgi:nucleotide-binding universal stress UspA family protein